MSPRRWRNQGIQEKLKISTFCDFAGPSAFVVDLLQENDASGGSKALKVRNWSEKSCFWRQFYYHLPAPYTAAATGTVLGVESEGNAKMSTFWGFPAFDPPRTLIFFDQVHHFCTGVRKVAKCQLFAVFMNFMVLSPPGLHFSGPSPLLFAKRRIVNFFEN